MNLRALRMFVATAQGGSLARASARLHVSQPAASRQLQMLEKELGVVLFRRTPRKLELTPEGGDLLGQSQDLLAAADRLTQRARALRSGRTGTLKVAATPHVIAGVLAPFLARFQSRHPAVRVELMEGGAARQPERLLKGDVQLAIMPVGDDRFDGRLLYPVHALVVVPKGHPLSRKSLIEIADLAEQPILVLRSEFGSRRWFEAACEIAQVRPQVRLESAAPQTLVELAAVGYGVAVVPSTVIVSSSDVCCLPLVQNKTSLGRWSMLAWDSKRRLPEYAQPFITELVEEVRTRYPGRAFLRKAPSIPRAAHPTD